MDKRKIRYNLCTKSINLIGLGITLDEWDSLDLRLKELFKQSAKALLMMMLVELDREREAIDA